MSGKNSDGEVDSMSQQSRDSNQTDSIIEELKALAKSMLDATNAARRRSSQLQGKRSVEHLVNATSYDAKQNHNGAGKPAHIDPFTVAPVSHETLTDIPSTLSPQYQKQTATGERGPTSANNTNDNSVALANLSSEMAEDDSSLATLEKSTTTKNRPEAPNESQEMEDEDEGVFDGVKTVLLFSSTDPTAYQDMVSSSWRPERLLLGPDGKAVPAKEADEVEEDDEEEGDEENEEAGKKVRRVYRIPYFPYGGGVTQQQLQDLSHQFAQCIRANASKSGGKSIRPAYISHSDFVSGNFPEVPVDRVEREEAFQPVSPYEFVVEVDRSVMFDAVRAREKRRAEFQQLVKENRAPATMGTFHLRVVMDPLKTGFEDEKNFPIIRGSIIADRYQIVQLLGKATFSRAVRCYDLHQPIFDDDDDDHPQGGSGEGQDEKEPIGYVEVCLKIINNTKDFFDQSLDEIRLLTLINQHKDPDEAHVVRLIDAFYHKEHTMLVTELLSDNLYEFSKYNREEEDEFYFTLPRLRRIARQVTEALVYVHSLNLIHADLKPENILFVSHRRCIVKVIDFGSSCFLSDHLSSYIQSRSYRAPEVVFGCDYDGRIDVWSLGGILVELVTGDVLFTSETVPEMLARMVYVCGQPFPRRMLWEGRHTNVFINKFGCIYESGSSAEQGGGGEADEDGENPYCLYTPVSPSPEVTATSPPPSSADGGGETSTNGDDDNDKSTPSLEEPYGVLWHKLSTAGMRNPEFFSFVKACLTLDPKARPTTEELLKHPFIANEKV